MRLAMKSGFGGFDVLGVIILAGGEGRRMHGMDKGWCRFSNGESFVEAVMSQLEQLGQYNEGNQVKLVISANRNLQAYQSLGKAVVPDIRSGFHGPLAGIESVMSAFQHASISRWCTWPVDSVTVPYEALQRLVAMDDGKIGYLADAHRQHFAHLSIPSSFRASISGYLNGGEGSIKGWLTQQRDYVVPLNLNPAERIENCNRWPQAVDGTNDVIRL